MRVSEITSFLEHAYGVLNDTYFEGSLPLWLSRFRAALRLMATILPGMRGVRMKRDIGKSIWGLKTSPGQ